MNNTVLPSQIKYFNIRLLALNKYILKETVHEIQITAERFYKKFFTETSGRIIIVTDLLN